jgi:hypothetical protein
MAMVSALCLVKRSPHSIIRGKEKHVTKNKIIINSVFEGIRTMKHLDLFSGIGGFAIATENVWDNVEHIFCDNDPFSQAVLLNHIPCYLLIL